VLTRSCVCHHRLREAVNVTIGPHWAEIKNSARYANTVRVVLVLCGTARIRGSVPTRRCGWRCLFAELKRTQNFTINSVLS
jgi:hypothetical protein